MSRSSDNRDAHMMRDGMLIGSLIAVLSNISHAAPSVSVTPSVQKPLTAQPIVIASKPDLSIKSLSVNSQCQIVVTTVNLGPGRLGDSVWTDKSPNSSGVYLTINGKSWGGGTIWVFDPSRQLQRAGGGASYTSNYVVKSRVTVLATIDHTAQVAETNESNNSLTATLECPSTTTVKPAVTLSPKALQPAPALGGRLTTGGGRTAPATPTAPEDSPASGTTAGSGDSYDPGTYSDPGYSAPPVSPSSGSLLQTPLPPPPQNVAVPVKADQTVEPGEIVIVSANLEEAQAVAAQAQALGLGIKRRRALASLGIVVTVFRLPAGYEVGDSLAAVRDALPSAWVDANHRYVLQGNNEKTYAARLVGVATSSSLCGQGVRIGMVDTAVDTRHPVFSGAAIVSHSVLPGGVNVADTDHGTAAAALMIGKPQASGYAGLTPAAKLYLVSVFRKNGKHMDTTAEWVAHALDWLAGQKVDVINLSLGGPRNLLVEASLERILDLNIPVIAAAGNGGPQAPPVYPAAQSGVIAVTAIDAQLQPWNKANRGNYVSFAAPGVDVWSAAPDKDGAYFSGTSYAAPLVTAVLAAERYRKPKAAWSAIFGDVIKRTRDLGESGRDAVYGLGLIQAGGACERAKK